MSFVQRLGLLAFQIRPSARANPTRKIIGLGLDGEDDLGVEGLRRVRHHLCELPGRLPCADQIDQNSKTV